MGTILEQKYLSLSDRLRQRASRALLTVLALALLSPVALPQTPAGQAPLPVTPPRAVAKPAAATVDDSAKLITEFEVNGLKVLLKRREGSQTVVAGLFFRGGARNITAENAGVEGLMLDVATEASANFPRERFRRELSRTGTAITYGMNLDYSALMLGSTRQYFERAWELFTDAAMRPSFAADDFQRVKQRLLVSLSDDEDTPDSFLQVLQSRAAYAGHPYLNDPRGTPKSVSALTVDDLKRYHQQMMQTSRLLLVVVGDLDAVQVRKMVEASFGKLPRGSFKESPVPQLSFPASTVTVTPRADSYELCFWRLCRTAADVSGHLSAANRSVDPAGTCVHGSQGPTQSFVCARCVPEQPGGQHWGDLCYVGRCQSGCDDNARRDCAIAKRGNHCRRTQGNDAAFSDSVLPWAGDQWRAGWRVGAGRTDRRRLAQLSGVHGSIAGCDTGGRQTGSATLHAQPSLRCNWRPEEYQPNGVHRSHGRIAKAGAGGRSRQRQEAQEKL